MSESPRLTVKPEGDEYAARLVGRFGYHGDVVIDVRVRDADPRGAVIALGRVLTEVYPLAFGIDAAPEPPK